MGVQLDLWTFTKACENKMLIPQCFKVVKLPAQRIIMSESNLQPYDHLRGDLDYFEVLWHQQMHIFHNIIMIEYLRVSRNKVEEKEDGST